MAILKSGQVEVEIGNMMKQEEMKGCGLPYLWTSCSVRGWFSLLLKPKAYNEPTNHSTYFLPISLCLTDKLKKTRAFSIGIHCMNYHPGTSAIKAKGPNFQVHGLEKAHNPYNMSVSNNILVICTEKWWCKHLTDITHSVFTATNQRCGIWPRLPVRQPGEDSSPPGTLCKLDF